MLHAVNVYYIWQELTGNSATTILTDLAEYRRSPYFNINTTYYDGAVNHVANSVHYGSHH